MRTVHKQTIQVDQTRYEIQLPLDARVLHVAAQTADEFALSLWYDCDDGVFKTMRRFEFFGTGHPVPDGAGYVSTHVLIGGSLVLHLFEIA